MRESSTWNKTEPSGNRDKAESTRLWLYCRCQQKHSGNYIVCWSSSSSVTASEETTAFPDPFLPPRGTRYLHAIISAGLTLEGLYPLLLACSPSRISHTENYSQDSACSGHAWPAPQPTFSLARGLLCVPGTEGSCYIRQLFFKRSYDPLAYDVLSTRGQLMTSLRPTAARMPARILSKSIRESVHFVAFSFLPLDLRKSLFYPFSS